jgi:hypothetical protein
MREELLYEVVQERSGWTLRRHGQTPLVEFPTRRQAVRAGIAVCRDEGSARLLIRRADGQEEELDPLVQPLESLEA